MASYSYSSSSDCDDFFGNDMEDLKRACMLTNSTGLADDCPFGFESDSDGGSSSASDDIGLLHRLQDRFSSLPSTSSAMSSPLVMPLSTRSPAYFDDEDDFATLRAIRMRFMQKEECDSSNKGLEDTSNQEELEMSSRFPRSAQNFVGALKKNRACQSLIRKKMLEIEKNMEKVKELKDLVQCLMSYQLMTKRKMGNQLGQKKDPRIRLISVEKPRAEKSTMKMSSRKAPFRFGPMENLQVAKYKMVLERFPISHRKEPWSNQEKENLANAIKHQFKEKFIYDSMYDSDNAEYIGGDLTSLISNDVIEVTPERITSFLPNLDWHHLASTFLHGRSSEECESTWLNCEDPTINHCPWTAAEDKKLLYIVQERGVYNWIDIAVALGTNRTPFQCLVRYQRSLNPHILNKDWTDVEDVKLRAAVKHYGDNNWQLVASCIEGRTGTQCSYRWRNTLKPERKRVGRWSVNEDKRLKAVVMLFGAKNWNKIAQFIPGRTQVQCRERWVNVLDPLLNLQPWTPEEDAKLLAAITEHGYRWSKIATCVPPRTDSQCRRRWKVLLPEEVPVRQAATKLKKSVLVNNFVDRESERPAIGPEDFARILQSTTHKKPDGRKCKKKRKVTYNQDMTIRSISATKSSQATDDGRSMRSRRNYTTKCNTVKKILEPNLKPQPTNFL